MEKRYEIVSLGVNCLPRTVLTRTGVKPAKAQGELSCPFDLVKHEPERIIYYLKNDFKDYFDDIFFTIRKRNFLDFRNKGLWQKTDGTKFFHDKDCDKDDLEKLTSRIKNRIKNFHAIVQAERPILFVICIFEGTDCIEELYSTLKQIRGDKVFKLAVINFSKSIIKPNNKIYSLELSMPCKTYKKVWNRTRFVKSKTGKYLESCIASFIVKILEKEFQED